MIKKSVVLAALLAAAPFAATAGDLNYTYVEAGYANLDIDSYFVNADFDGFQLRGSAAVAENIYVFGGYGSVTNDDFGADIDFDELQLGAGYRHAINPRADLIGELGYIAQEVSIPGASDDTDGVRLSGGIRGLLADNFEGLAKVSYTDGDHFDGDFSFTAGAQYKFTQTWGVVGEIETGDDVTKYLVGVRASF